MPTEHEAHEARERERRGSELTEEDLRHNYVARTAAARSEADRLGEPALKKATRVWEQVETITLDPSVHRVTPIEEGDAIEADQGGTVIAVNRPPRCFQHDARCEGAGECSIQGCVITRRQRGEPIP